MAGRLVGWALWALWVIHLLQMMPGECEAGRNLFRKKFYTPQVIRREDFVAPPESMQEQYEGRFNAKKLRFGDQEKDSNVSVSIIVYSHNSAPRIVATLNSITQSINSFLFIDQVRI